MKTIATKIQINAPIDLVWNVLMDFDKHPQWNPFIKKITGIPRAGSLLKVTIAPPHGKGMTFTPVVASIIPYYEFRWSGKLVMKGIFDGEHYFTVDRIDSKTTLFRHGEFFSGLLVTLMGNALDATSLGFEKMNEALKKECERKYSQQ